MRFGRSPKFLQAEWRHLVMLSYEIDPGFLRPWLPDGLQLSLWRKKAFLTVVGLWSRNARIAGVKLPVYGRFEQVNLRFYVERQLDQEIRRGVMFIKQIVPAKPIALASRYVFRENCVALPMKHDFRITPGRKDDCYRLSYSWNTGERWQRMGVKTSSPPTPLKDGTLPHFLAERYYGYSGLASREVLEYRVQHPSWKIRMADVDCDWELSGFYGRTIGRLVETAPDCAFVAEGSEANLYLPVRI